MRILSTRASLKPFEIEADRISPAFNQPELGIQYLSPVSADVLLRHGVIGY